MRGNQKNNAVYSEFNLLFICLVHAKNYLTKNRYLHNCLHYFQQINLVSFKMTEKIDLNMFQLYILFGRVYSYQINLLVNKSR